MRQTVNQKIEIMNDTFQLTGRNFDTANAIGKYVEEHPPQTGLQGLGNFLLALTGAGLVFGSIYFAAENLDRLVDGRNLLTTSH